LNDSTAGGLSWELEVGVFVSGVGIEWMCLWATFRNELNEETATSGDWGESRWALSGSEPASG
jgi:hypothetical protein